MQSLALFPCSYTDEAGIIGELSNSLQLRVYTDEMLFCDVSQQFGIQIDKLKRILFSLSMELNRYKLKKEQYINLLKCTLEARRRLTPGGCIFYGVHTSLLDPENDRVLKVLVFDNQKSRVRRAMQQERFSAATAREHIREHDKKVTEWAQFLFNKNAYSRSLFNLVVLWKNKSLIDITTYIVKQFHNGDFSLQQELTGNGTNHQKVSLQESAFL
jgi:cytidylate kinase